MSGNSRFWKLASGEWPPELLNGLLVEDAAGWVLRARIGGRRRIQFSCVPPVRPFGMSAYRLELVATGCPETRPGASKVTPPFRQ